MPHDTTAINNIAPTATTAPLRNVALFAGLVDQVVNRPRHLPGLAVFHGFSGYGKTRAAVYAANKHRAYYVEVGESWTKAKFCRALLTELGRQPKGTVADMVDQIIGHLVVTERPLIIDEFDHVVRRRYHELVREIHDKTEAPIIAVGEELRQAFGAGRVNELTANDAWYREHGPKLRSAFEDRTIAIPADVDVRNDLRQLRSINGVIKVPREVRTTGTDEGTRHADTAIALYNFMAATLSEAVDYGYAPAPRLRPHIDEPPAAPEGLRLDAPAEGDIEAVDFRPKGAW